MISRYSRKELTSIWSEENKYKIWLEIERTYGVDLSKESLAYFRPPRSRRSLGLNLKVDQVVWWPYKSARGSMALEIKVTRLKPTEVLASTFETRTFAHRIGGIDKESFQKIFLPRAVYKRLRQAKLASQPTYLYVGLR